MLFEKQTTKGATQNATYCPRPSEHTASGVVGDTSGGSINQGMWHVRETCNISPTKKQNRPLGMVM